MDTRSSVSVDPALFLIALIFFGGAIATRLSKWFQIHTAGSYLALVLTVSLLVGICGYLIIVRLRRHWARLKYEKSILGPGPDAVYCGFEKNAGSVYVKPRQRIMHTQIVGTTNAGKTESVILPWAIQDIEQGRGLLLIDGKADRDLLEKLWAYTVKAGRERDFKLFSLGSMNQSHSFNPLIGGTAEEITERIFSAFTFENEFYRSLQYEVLAQTLRIFEASGEIPTFLKLHQAISNPSLLEKLCERCKERNAYDWLMHFKGMSGSDREQRTSGLTSQLSHFAFGKVSPLFNRVCPDIIIHEALSSGQIVYFQLPVLLSPFLGAATGKLVLQCLQAAIANRHRDASYGKPFYSVFLDDFSEYLYPGFVSVLNKSRSANIGVVFAHQALGDIETLGDAIANAILTNSNLKIFMRGNDPDSAEHFSKIVGTKSTMKLTERRKLTMLQNQGTGDVSAREVEEFVIHPNHFKRGLGVGEAVMIVPHERGTKTIQIKFERFPDIPNVPFQEVTQFHSEGFAEIAKKIGTRNGSLSEVLRSKNKEPECSRSTSL